VNVLKPSIVTTELVPNVAIQATCEYLSATTAMVLMNPCEAEALMRLTAMVSCNRLSVNADIIIETAASSNFVSKEFVMANGFYIDCNTIPKLSNRVASDRVFLQLKCFVLRFSPLMDTNPLPYNLEIFLTLKVHMLSRDYRL
jgi:hypothetical protein